MKVVFQLLLALVVILVVFSFAEAVVCPPKNDADVTLLPNPDDCKTFYLCDNGLPYLMQCPDGLEFNHIERVCDLPEHAKCVSSAVSSTTAPTTETPIIVTT